jgi:hypothetical protein
VPIIDPRLPVLRIVHSVSNIDFANVHVARANLPAINVRPISIADVRAIVSDPGSVLLTDIRPTIAGSWPIADSRPGRGSQAGVIAGPRDSAARPGARLIS